MTSLVRIFTSFTVTLLTVVFLSLLLSPFVWVLWNFVMPNIGVRPIAWIDAYAITVLAHMIFPGVGSN